MYFGSGLCYSESAAVLYLTTVKFAISTGLTKCILCKQVLNGEILIEQKI